MQRLDTFLVFCLLTGTVLTSGPPTLRRSRVRRQNMKVRINATGDTIVMKFVRPNEDTKLEGYILGYGSSMFSKQFIQLPENGLPYETEIDAEPKYLIAVQPIPVNDVKKQCSGKVNLEKPLHLVIGSVTPTSVLLSWGTILKTPYEGNIMSDCLEDGHYTVRYRERNRKWTYQTCPTSDTVIDKLKPNTAYEFGVRPNSEESSGGWSKPVTHSTNMGEKAMQKPYKPVKPVKPIMAGPHVFFPPRHVLHNRTQGRQPPLLRRPLSPRTNIAPPNVTRTHLLPTPGPTMPLATHQPIGSVDRSRSAPSSSVEVPPASHQPTQTPIILPTPIITHQRQSKPRTRPQPQPNPQPKSQPNPQPKPQPQPNPQPKPQPQPQPQPEARPRPQPQPQPETRPQPQPQLQPEARPQPRPQPQPETRPQPQPQLQPEARPQPRPQPQPETRPQPQPQPQPEARPQPQSQPQPEARPQPQSQPQPEARPQPQPQPQPQSQSESQSHPQTKPHLRSQPQPQPTRVLLKAGVPTAPSTPVVVGKPLPRPALASERANSNNQQGTRHPRPSTNSVPRSPSGSSVPVASRNATSLPRRRVSLSSSPNVARPLSPPRGAANNPLSSSSPGGTPAVLRPSPPVNKSTNLVGTPGDKDKPMDLKQGDKASILKPFPVTVKTPKQERRQTTTLAPVFNGSRFDMWDNSSVFSSHPASEVDAMGKKRFVAPHVIYKTDKKPDEPCSITNSLSFFPEEEGGGQNVTGPPRTSPSNLTVVTVEGCPSFVILDWEKTNDTTEYEVISTTSGPNGEEVSILTTNQTHTAVENLKPESSYEFTVKPKNELGAGPTSDPVSFSTESADPRVSENVSGKDAIWTQFPFKSDAYSECNGKQYVKRTWYRKFVGIQLCNSLRYKIYLSDSLTGKFYNIGDQTGHGEDHCQFVDSFLDGRTGTQLLADQLPHRSGFYRAMRQEPVNFGEMGGNSHITYVGWYECGTPIPGKW
ncbi:target of Nesh-SH3 isoform X2 [Osmerus eperlanus]|uniref:target of Nesh-SH3 isoform X2 n=1 Tax=Osmerus eperlanus TaxID=29151 RepID=UPI002E112F46